MGNPILYRGALNVMIKKYTDMYKQNPDIYGKAIYIDKKGVKYNDDTEYGVVAGENSFVITVCNTSGEDITDRIVFDLDQMGYHGREISKITDLFNEVTQKGFKDNSFMITAKDGNIVSYLITLKQK